MNNIEEIWKGYSKTLPPGASPEQILEAHLGFFSGATAIFALMMEKAMDPTVSQEEGQEFLDELDTELKQFRKRVQAKDQQFFTTLDRP